MIAKITTGVRFGGLATYLHGPGRANEHTYGGRVGGAVIGGNLGAEGDVQGGRWASLLREAAASRPEIARPVWHVSLRNGPGDRRLTDAQWADAGQDFAEKMGFETRPWVMVRHGEDHVHLVVSRVAFNGQVWSNGNDRYKAQRACAAIETSLGLVVAPRVSTAISQRPADHQVSAGEWRRALRQEKAPQRVVLAEAVLHAAAAVQGGGRPAFEDALDRTGIEYRVNVAATGRVSGYRFHLPSHVDGAGQAVWFKASQLDKVLSWSILGAALEAPAPAPQAAVASKGLLESRKHHAQRVADVQTAERGARIQGVPIQAATGVAERDAWWVSRAQHERDQIAVRALERQRAAAAWARRPAALAALSFPTPTLSLAAQAELQRSIEQASHAAAWRRVQPPTAERGPSQGR